MGTYRFQTGFGVTLEYELERVTIQTENGSEPRWKVTWEPEEKALQCEMYQLPRDEVGLDNLADSLAAARLIEQQSLSPSEQIGSAFAQLWAEVQVRTGQVYSSCLWAQQFDPFTRLTVLVSGTDADFLSSKAEIVTSTGIALAERDSSADGGRVEKYFDPTNQQPWSTRTIEYNVDGAVTADIKNYETFALWTQLHDLSGTHMGGLDEAAAAAFTAEVGYRGLTGTVLPSDIPLPLSYEDGFASAYDLDLGSLMVTGGSSANVSYVPPAISGGFDYSGVIGISGSSDGPIKVSVNLLDLGALLGAAFGWLWPVALDLDGNGIDVKPRTGSHVYFNVDGDAAKEQTAWIGPGDGMLVQDLNGDGQIAREELSFALRTPDPNDTDLAALKGLFDTDRDNRLTAGELAPLRVWKDANQDAVVQSGELVTPASLGISAIGLSADHAATALADGTRIAGFADLVINGVGRRGVADVGLAFNPVGFTRNPHDQYFFDYVAENGTARSFLDIRGHSPQTGTSTITVGEFGTTIHYSDWGDLPPPFNKRVDGVFTGPLNDEIVASTRVAKGVLMHGGGGDDKLWGGAAADVLEGGPGRDLLFGGGGDDTLYFDAADLTGADARVDGFVGYDTGVLTSPTPLLNFTLAAYGLEALIANEAADTIIGNPAAAGFIDGRGGDDRIVGGTADDVLVGGTGNDTITAGGGHDLVNGGAGNDTLNGEDGNDALFGGAGSDRLYGDGNEDTLTGGAGDDALAGGAGIDTAVYAGAAARYAVVTFGGQLHAIAADGEGHDTLAGIEVVRFADRNLAAATAPAFDALGYLATYADLRAAYGINAQAGFDHYAGNGFREGRQVGFDGLTYIASYADLIGTLGADRDAGARHFIEHGLAEGRHVSFDAAGYLARNPDLGLGNDLGAAALHYITQGYAQGRQWAPPPARPHDVDGDGKADILWRNDSGYIGLWELDGAHMRSGQGVAAQPNDWHVAGAADFNADGRSDILWRNDGGYVGIWEMDGFRVLAGQGVGPQSLDWRIAGTGDFDGDRHGDILWRHDSGLVGIWEMDGFRVLSGQGVGPQSTAWHVAGTGDFDGDRLTDILWRHDDGTVAVWQMRGFQVLSAHDVVAGVPAAWRVAGVADFNGDRKSDILWRNDNGAVALWDMDNGGLAGTHDLPLVSNDWHIADAADFDGDGKSDILWRNDNGTVAVWQMNGGQILGTGTIGSITADWHVLA